MTSICNPPPILEYRKLLNMEPYWSFNGVPFREPINSINYFSTGPWISFFIWKPIDTSIGNFKAPYVVQPTNQAIWLSTPDPIFQYTIRNIVVNTTIRAITFEFITETNSSMKMNDISLIYNGTNHTRYLFDNRHMYEFPLPWLRS